MEAEVVIAYTEEWVKLDIENSRNVMATLVCDATIEQQILAQRAASGADRFDEVWERIYMMAPMPNDEHQEIVNGLAAIFQEMIGWPGRGHIRPGVNVSDRKEGWRENYRVPDVAVFLEGSTAENCDAFWFGGPDFAVEVVSADDQSRKKLPFYAQVNVREILFVDRDPWCLELVRIENKASESSIRCQVGDAPLASHVLPFDFALQSGAKRPVIRVTHQDGKQWLV